MMDPGSESLYHLLNEQRRREDADKVDIDSYMVTSSGLHFQFLDPQPEQIDIYDVAMSLARTARFRGHGRRFYSVAEHSVHVLRLVKLAHPNAPALHVAALLHDAHEAYIGDVPTPLKRAVPGFRAVEGRVATAVRLALAPNVDPDYYDGIVRERDRIALFLESLYLFDPLPRWVEAAREEWGPFVGATPLPASNLPAELFMEEARDLGLA